MTANLHDVCDYIISRVCNAGSSMNELKLQKLLYYAQAWHLAVFGSRLFDERFQAWVHGPVSRAVYDRFGATKSLYSPVELSDVRPKFDFKALTEEQREHIDSVLEVYAGYTGTQLEQLTHNEEPWMQARVGYRESQRCEVEIDEDLMRQFYGQRLNVTLA